MGEKCVTASCVDRCAYCGIERVELVSPVLEVLDLQALLYFQTSRPSTVVSREHRRQVAEVADPSRNLQQVCITDFLAVSGHTERSWSGPEANRTVLS